ncbi:dihydrofolate reductase family protein [Actinoplanes sp. CA-142083]|uniref:dihydrofolate reductase family protein n=1 Tax=Actinoplanes sp. CA-142083 TaxID=3239903 RepID=UPI003D8A14DC
MGLREWFHATIVSRAEFPALARELKQKPGQDIIQYGYGPVTAALLREGLLDELRLWVHPITVGGPPRDALLAEVSGEARFRLVDHRVCGSGMVILSYQPA